jgi:hypothetical protein
MKADLEASRTRQRLERQHRELRKGLQAGAFGWMLPRFVSGSVLGVGVTMLMSWTLGDGSGVVDGSSPGFWFRLLAPVVVVGAVTPYLYLRARRRSRRPVDEIVREADAEVTALTAPGWVGRVIRQGALMAAGIGLPVGTILAMGLPVEELPAGSRLLAVAGFALLTAGWTLPAAFGLRWLSLMTHGRQS